MKKEVTLQESLITDLRTLINEARNKVALIVNTEITLLYWHIGKRINEEVLGNQRAEYGKQIVSTLSTQLTKEYGRGFELRNLRRMMQFAELFPDFQIVATASQQLSWSHFIELLSIKNDLGREFYLTMAASESWSIRTLRNKIDSMLYERTLSVVSLRRLSKQNWLTCAIMRYSHPTWFSKALTFWNLQDLKEYIVKSH